MITRSLQDLRLDAAKLADLEGYVQPTVGSDSRYGITELNRYVNEGIAELWDLLIAAQGYNYYGKTYLVQSNYAQVGSGPSLTGKVLATPNYKESTIAKTMVITIGTGGALGTATFTYTVSSETNGVTTVFTTATDGLWTCADGIIVSFPAGTYVAATTYTFTFDKPSTVAGVVSYDLPQDFYKIHKMWIGSPNSFDFIDLQRVASGNEPFLRRGDIYIRPTHYEVRRNCVDILPSVNGAQTISMLYIPRAPVLQNDADGFDGINGFEDYVAAYAASRMLLKEGDIEYINMLTGLVTNKLKGRIQTMAADRDRGTPQKVQDTRGSISGRYNRGRRRVF